MSAREVARDGFTISDSPEVKTYEWIDKRTGQVHEVPVGIDPGWAYHVGRDGFMETGA